MREVDLKRWYEYRDELPHAFVELAGAVQRGDEKEIKRIRKRIRKLIDGLGPEFVGYVIGLGWLGASPEVRRFVEENLSALEEIHPGAAQWARFYIERAKLQEKILADGVGIFVI